MVFLSLGVYALGYVGIRQPGIFSEGRPVRRAKYGRSGLDVRRARRLVSALLRIMDERQPYLSPEIKLETLARELGASANHLSQALNQLEKRNFHQFVNDYRVRAARARLERPSSDSVTLLAIAQESGFRSKSTFNAAFKERTGLTPSEYRRRARDTDRAAGN